MSLDWQPALGIDLDIPDDFGYWLAGLTDGEGCFDIYHYKKTGELACRFMIGLRCDDRPVLEQIKNMLGIGRLYVNKRIKPTWASIAIYFVYRHADIVHVLIPLFEKYPLRSKKRHDYGLWKQAARIILSKQHLTPGGRTEVLQLKAEMGAGRKYNGSNGITNGISEDT